MQERLYRLPAASPRDLGESFLIFEQDFVGDREFQSAVLQGVGDLAVGARFAEELQQDVRINTYRHPA